MGAQMGGPSNGQMGGARSSQHVPPGMPQLGANVIDPRGGPSLMPGRGPGPALGPGPGLPGGVGPGGMQPRPPAMPPRLRAQQSFGLYRFINQEGKIPCHPL